MKDDLLRADCARCAALCCFGLAFDRSEMFAFDKPAGVGCPNLGDDYQCRIHGSLETRGFGGCVRFDCLGAGQRVTQELFGGRSWREEPALIQPMIDAFRVMRQIHELLLLLQTAGKLSLKPGQVERRDQLLEGLLPAKGWSLRMLEEFERGGVVAEVEGFLADLKDHVVRE